MFTVLLPKRIVNRLNQCRAIDVPLRLFGEPRSQKNKLNAAP
jgi:hypothetical protein